MTRLSVEALAAELEVMSHETLALELACAKEQNAILLERIAHLRAELDQLRYLNSESETLSPPSGDTGNLPTLPSPAPPPSETGNEDAG